ncbi:MAG: aminoacyl-histidine dipeptidase [Prevotellaceae bacterium]|jgi:dipeptidase D|nr:aminoacyl-histidine dipeptidase [Prevotellaceae bacterium]
MNFQTEIVLRFFDEISRIPRPSKHEEQIRRYLIHFAEQHALPWIVDDAGNVLISKPGTQGQEQRPVVVLQSHIDMVGEKDSSSTHNFLTDPISVYRDGDRLRAHGTTLGADNGIGMAMQLALLSIDTVMHPPLECLFTVDEETGLYGASNLSPDLLRGRTMINLDTEEEGEFCIGCAGGTDTLAEIRFERQVIPEGFFFFRVRISGLQGGHSGEDINKHRANAIKLLAGYLQCVVQQSDLRVACIEGGNLRNAIPREAGALLAVPFADKELVRIVLNHFIVDSEEQFPAETGLCIELESAYEEQSEMLPKSISDGVIRALNACPNGVIAMSRQIADLVETSTNLAAVRSGDDFVRIETSQRSSSETEKHNIAQRVAAVFSAEGATITTGKDYPGWEPNPDSVVLQRSIAAYRRLFGSEPVVKAIHAGLECGVILGKYPDMDIVSLGPTIEGAHSPAESVSISSVERCWQLLLEILNS